MDLELFKFQAALLYFTHPLSVFILMGRKTQRQRESSCQVIIYGNNMKLMKQLHEFVRDPMIHCSNISLGYGSLIQDIWQEFM